MTHPNDVVIVAGIRTAFTGCHGPLSGWHPADLCGEILAELGRATTLDPATIDEVIVGTASPVGAQGQNLARGAVLTAAWPESVMAHTVEGDRLSGPLAIRAAASLVAAQQADLVVAAGVDVMSLVPAGSASLDRNYGRPWGDAALGRYLPAGGLVPLGVLADRLADAHGLARRDLDEWTATSHRRAVEHPASVLRLAARFDDRADAPHRGEIALDSEPDPTIDIASLAELASLHDDGSPITAGNLARPGDGAAGVLLTRRRVADDRGLPIVATLAGFGSVGGSPAAGPNLAAAASDALDRVGLTPSHIAAWEIDEPTAAHVLEAVRSLDVDPECVNRHGGSLAIGDPRGASAIRQLLHLIEALTVTSGRGIVSTGGDGGLALAMVVDGEPG